MRELAKGEPLAKRGTQTAKGDHGVGIDEALLVKRTGVSFIEVVESGMVREVVIGLMAVKLADANAAGPAKLAIVVANILDGFRWIKKLGKHLGVVMRKRWMCSSTFSSSEVSSTRFTIADSEAPSPHSVCEKL